MAVSSEQAAPYLAPGVMLPLLARNREKGLPNPITAEALQRLGVSDSLVPRAIQAFKTLDLIGEDGRHTEILENFRHIAEADYKPAMAQWLEAAYDHALDVIDPATADEVALRDAFRNCNPMSMQPRMITLFVALFEEAGVRSPERSKATAKKPTQGNVAPRAFRPPGIRQISQRTPVSSPYKRDQPPALPAGLHPALAGLLASLPPPTRGWSKEERDRWYSAFGVVLDLAIPPGVFVPTLPDIAEADHADG